MLATAPTESEESEEREVRERLEKVESEEIDEIDKSKLLLGFANEDDGRVWLRWELEEGEFGT